MCDGLLVEPDRKETFSKSQDKTLASSSDNSLSWCCFARCFARGGNFVTWRTAGKKSFFFVLVLVRILRVDRYIIIFLTF
jgi:hypothetical protein